jgi:hypothetical protein
MVASNDLAMKTPVTAIPKHRLPLILIGLLTFHPLHAEWRMEILPDEWQIAGFENSLDLSGIAAANATQCLVGSDESYYVQPGVIDPAKRRIESLRPIALEVSSEPRKAEVDIEGVAYCPWEKAYYVVGSHGVGKKKGNFDPDRHSIYRMRVDPEKGTVVKDGIQRTSLLPWLEKTPVLAGHVKAPLQQNGLNIEGLTVSGDRLFLGLRAPNKDGRGLVLEADPADLFQGEPRSLKVHEIAIEDGRGIREIVAVSGGFILVTGNASAEPTKKIPQTLAKGPDNRFEILFWDGINAAPATIGTLPENGGKGEGLLVLSDTGKWIDLLVVFDGLPGGEPLALRIHR